MELLYQEETYAIQGAIVAVYEGMGCGFLEEVYQECFEKNIIELKAVRELAPEHWAQVVNYLKVTGCRVGLLVNFCHYPKADVRRIVL